MASRNCDPYNPNSNNSIYCSPGCLYSSLKQNYCPLSCSSECFACCNQTLFCAPGCSYYDLNAGQCILCPSNCLKYCNLDNLCTSSCSSSHCSKTCPSICCDYKQYSSASENSLSWIIPLVIICAVFICIIFSVLLCRVRKSEQVSQVNRNIHNQNESHQEISNLVQSINLTPIKFQSSLKFVGEKICTIDLMEISEGEEIIFTPCLHIFHAGCLKQWIESNTREKLCPNCKFNLMGYSIS